MTAKEKEAHLILLEKIRDARKAKGYSQTDIAEKLGLSQYQYSIFETGKTTVPLERFLLIAKILDMDFDLMPNKKEQEKQYFDEFINRIKGVFSDEKQSPQTS